MKTLSGYLLVKETQVGVPRLVVAGYDSETTIQATDKRKLSAQFIQQLGKRIGAAIRRK
jgi:hypothetical protein